MLMFEYPFAARTEFTLLASVFQAEAVILEAGFPEIIAVESELVHAKLDIAEFVVTVWVELSPYEEELI
jgi:hypothetical protein